MRERLSRESQSLLFFENINIFSIRTRAIFLADQPDLASQKAIGSYPSYGFLNYASHSIPNIFHSTTEQWFSFSLQRLFPPSVVFLSFSSTVVHFLMITGAQSTPVIWYENSRGEPGARQETWFTCPPPDEARVLNKHDEENLGRIPPKAGPNHRLNPLGCAGKVTFDAKLFRLISQALSK